MSVCGIAHPTLHQIDVCRLDHLHPGKHEWETEDEYLARVMPERDDTATQAPSLSLAARLQASWEEGRRSLVATSLPAPAPTAKPRYVLVPPLALRAVARVLTHGAAQHEDYGWRTRLAAPGGQALFVDKALRHFEEHRCGRRKDPDSGESPLACAIANLLFLLEREEEERGEGNG